MNSYCMPKEWVLNQSNMRWGLNKKKNVGPVMKEIRKCSPITLKDWEEYYYKNIYPKEHLEQLGNKLYNNIKTTVADEINNITKEDCKNFVKNLVINRTYQGYITEITVVHKQLEKELGIKIEEAPDEWDRLFNVDYYIKVGKRYIGLQIKPIGVSGDSDLEVIKEKIQQRKTFNEFTKTYGGKVFYVFSIEDSKEKTIANPEVIAEIKKELNRLSKET